jgi:pimeloyl-[acyl-carrier protein] methyl ester esterase
MNASATPRIFLSGWCLGRGPLQATVDAVGGQILDLPGYGNRPLIADFDAACDALAADLPEQAQLCGWSLGAEMALAIATRHPEKISRLVLIAGTASFVQRSGWPHAMPPATLAEFSQAVASDVEAVLPRFVGNFNRGDARHKAVSRSLLDLADPRPPAATLNTGLDWLRDVDLRERCAAVQAPTLLLHGAADPLMPIAAAEALAKLLPNARLSVLADCAHAPFISQPEEFRQRLAAFLNEST